MATTAAYAAGLAFWWALRGHANPSCAGSALAMLLLLELAVFNGIANLLTLTLTLTLTPIGPAGCGDGCLRAFHVGRRGQCRRLAVLRGHRAATPTRPA